ncbi:MAG: hypothetical protein QNJ60_02260 [Xenococcaceae cyanobacterium MO_188.B19]|nr:hypothetical protein [Xenococcaceae cyanobacterium MO_188.B19]
MSPSNSGTIYINKNKYPLVQGTCVVIEVGELQETVNTGNSNLVLTYFSIKI